MRSDRSIRGSDRPIIVLSNQSCRVGFERTVDWIGLSKGGSDRSKCVRRDDVASVGKGVRDRIDRSEIGASEVGSVDPKS